MDRPTPSEPGKVPGIAAKLASIGFLAPTVAVGATVALAVSQFVPTTYERPQTSSTTRQAQAAELKSVDTSNVEKASAEPVTGANLSAADYGIDAANLKDGVYTGSGTGFSGTITVQVTVQGGKIVAIEVLSTSDDAAYFNRARGVISSVIAAQSTSVDTVSGATYSSKGILMAIRNALIQATGGIAEATAPATTPKADKPHVSIDTTAPASGYADGAYLGTGEGYNGQMTVRVTISGGKIASIEMVSNVDDPAYFGRAWASVPGRIVSAQSVAVDTVSGATYSSEGILDAVQNALKQAAAAAGKTDPSPAPDPTPDPTPDPDPDPSPTPNPGDDTDATHYEDGEYTAYALCQNEEDEEEFNAYYVALTVVVEDGKPVEIKDIHGSGTGGALDEALDPFDDDNQIYLDYAINGRTLRGKLYPGVVSQLIESKRKPADIDVVSRSTYSSRAIAKAYEKALELAEQAYSDAHPGEAEDGGADA